MKKNTEKRRPMSFRSIAVRVISLTLVLWITAMGLLTWAVAEDMYTQLEIIAGRLASSAANISEPAADGSYDKINMIRHLGSPYYPYKLNRLLPIVMPQFQDSMGTHNRLWGKWDLLFGYEAATIYYGEDREILIQTGNYMVLNYTTDNCWYAGNSEMTGECFLALDEIEGGTEALGKKISSNPWGDISGFNGYPSILRLQGYFEGDQFHPIKVEGGYDPLGLSDTLEKLNYADIILERIQWETLLEVEQSADRETQVIYARFGGGYRSTLQPVTAKGTTFDSLTDLLNDNYTVRGPYDRKNLFDSIIITCAWGDGLESAVAIRCWPLQYAVRRMIPAYLVSLTVIGLVLWLILGKIYKNLTSPLLDMATATATATGREITPSAGWWEPYQIQKYLCETRQTLTDTNARLKQTETALEYAHHAEENRKQLISNLTHELKTPLAIIHSYTEGLMEGIAEDKREQYLSVILEQSERMDALVLQMLDLSRLEAGKVRLTMELVALLKLTQAITDRFIPLLAEKKLTLRYDMVEDLTVPADEARMEQVITNLVSNAVKYSPPGGTIWLNLYLFSGQVHFFIGNTAPHLSDEALEKVWDSFYRADPSRTEPGTGLGLALVKGIVSLHRGECTVRNTSAEGQSAVEFGFTLPVH